MKRYEILELLRRHESLGEIPAFNKAAEYANQLCESMVGRTLTSMLEGSSPTFRGDIDPRYDILADVFDYMAKLRGLSVRAYRSEERFVNEEKLLRTISASALVEEIANAILIRKGEAIDQDLAYERSRNIVQGLLLTTVR